MVWEISPHHPHLAALPNPAVGFGGGGWGVQEGNFLFSEKKKKKEKKALREFECVWSLFHAQSMRPSEFGLYIGYISSGV